MKKYTAFLKLFLVPLFLLSPVISHAEWIGELNSHTIDTVDLKARGNVTINGHVVDTPDLTYTSLSKTTTLSPWGKHLMVINGTGAIVMSSLPTISTTAATNGQELRILGGANAVTFTDNDTLPGTLLELGSTTRAIGTGQWLDLIYYGGKWYERYNPAATWNQDVDTTSDVTFASVNTGGAMVFSGGITQATAEGQNLAAGTMFRCTDCTVTPICVSTGGLHGIVAVSTLSQDCD